MAQEKAEPHISLPVHLLPRVPASLSVQPTDERMTSESLPQLEGLMLLTKPAAGDCSPQTLSPGAPGPQQRK